MEKTTLLLVEDNIILRDALQEVLSMEGFHVFTASNGKEALATMEIVLPELIISDISMPEMDGREFFKVVQSQPQWAAIPFIFLTARSNEGDAEARIRNLGAEDYLSKPINQAELVATIRARLKRNQQLEMIRLREAYKASLTMLTEAIEARDRYVIGHVDRVQRYAVSLGKALNWDEVRLQNLRFGAILHDIGKIYIEERILCKAEPITTQEWEIIHAHPCRGVEMLEKIPYLAPAIPLVHFHHERWNGSGYPKGLCEEEIPLGARIVAVADVFDAMTSTRIYREAHSLEEAYRKILGGSGVLFDPEIVNVFKSLWQRGAIHKIAEIGG